MKLLSTVAVTLGVVFALAPRPTQAGDVERVQRACAELRQIPALVHDAHPARTATMALAKFNNNPYFVSQVVEARFFELLCK